MTRLLFLAACFAGALATYHGEGDKMAGSNMAAEGSSGYMSKGADQKNAMEMNSGDMMSGDKSAKHMKNGDKKAGSGAASADSAITVLTSCKGGNAPVEQIAQPSMDKGTMHKVIVGGDAGLVFSPNTLTAMPGDMVEFTFMSMNHTLTQSTFPEPCKKMKDGADSGFLANPDNTVSPPPTYMFQIKDTKPLWFYCKQKKPTSHCGKGMTFSINPTPDKSHEAFTATAMQQNGTAPDGAAAAAAAPPPAETTSMPPPADTNTMPAAAETPYTTSTPPAAESPPSSPPLAEAPAANPAPPAEMPPANPAPAADSPPQEPANLSSAPAPAGGNNMMAGSGSFPAGAGVGMYGGWSGSVGM
ncbi:MAG: hypothetical protein LQ337_004816 [Flavoplaca oasis]|nr:MAG: hypothetical protein LQ337_004816 [Flavoplaca oasis]